MPPAPLDDELVYSTQRLVAIFGREFVLSLHEVVEDKVPRDNAQVIFRQLAISPLWGGLREISDAAMETMVTFTERNLPFSVRVECNPHAHAAGERVRFDILTDPDYRYVAKMRPEPKLAAPRPVSPAGTAPPKRSSPGALRERGPRY